MKKDEKNSSAVRTICTRSVAASTPPPIEQQTNPSLRRSTRGMPTTKPITPPSATRKSERLAPSPASVAKKFGVMEKKNTPSPLRRSDRGKNVVSSQSSKGSDHSSRNADASSDIEQRKDKKKNNVEESTNEIKKREPIMSARSFRALFRSLNNKSEALVDPASNDEELVVVGCSRRIPASNDDAAQDGNTNCPPPANAEPKKLPVGETSLEKGTDSPLKSIRDTEKMVLDASPMVETEGDNVIGATSENSETQKLLFSKTSLETDTGLPLKRKRDTPEIELDACATVANGDDRVMSSDGVIPFPSGCKNDVQPETCNTCGKRQK